MPVIGRQIRGPSPLTQSSPSSNGTSRCAHGNVPDESLPQFTAPKTVRATGRRRIRGTTAGACKVTSDTGTRRKCRRMWSSVWTSIAGSSSPGHPFSSPAPSAPSGPTPSCYWYWDSAKCAVPVTSKMQWLVKSCALCAIVFIVRNMSCSHNWEWRLLSFEQRDYGMRSQRTARDGTRTRKTAAVMPRCLRISAGRSFFNLDRTRETQRLHHCNDRVHVDFLGKGGGMASGTPLAVWPSRTGGGYSEPPTCKSLAIPNGLLVGTPERSKCSLRMTFWRRKWR